MDTDDGISRCSTLANVFYVVYTLISSVLLVNLLIATFSGSYERVSEDATKTWLYYRFDIISEFIEKPVLPPPFIVVNHVWRLIQFCISSERFHDLKLSSGDIKVKWGIDAETELQDFQKRAINKIKKDKSTDAYKFNRALKDVEKFKDWRAWEHFSKKWSGCKGTHNTLSKSPMIGWI